jgi:hypothetical protein
MRVCLDLISLRLDGNQNIEAGSEGMKIGDFKLYDHHRRSGFFQSYLSMQKV